MTATRLAIHLGAPRERVYRALLDPAEVRRWQVPDDMTSVVHAFEPVEGGAFRVSLTYQAADAVGKSQANTDTYHGRFTRLVPGERVEQALAFESNDPRMQGTMTLRYQLQGAGRGTLLEVEHAGLPPGLAPADNALGWHLSLEKLATLVEGRPPVTIRLLAEADLPMLHDWLNRPHVVQWWGGERPTLDEVMAQYPPQVMAQDGVTPYIVMLGDTPIAYAQSYVAMGSGGGWWEAETDPGVRGIDQSIADPALLGRGLGTVLVRTLVGQLFRDPQVTKVQTDPAPDNPRAIRCYEKAGFRTVGKITTPDGPALYMQVTRAQWEGTSP